MRKYVCAGLIALGVSFVGGDVLEAQAAEVADLPVVYNALAAAPGIAAPDSPPPGANDWNCAPSAAHPYPVVLVHGTGANMRLNWNALSPLLKNNRYCVYALNFGANIVTNLSAGVVNALGPITESAGELSAFVDRVLAATHAPKVDIVGHSQGGMMPNYYIKFLGGAPKVHSMVGLAPDNHGTDVSGLLHLANALTQAFPGLAAFVYNIVGEFAPGGVDQKFDSPFIKKLNSVPDTVSGIRYTVIATHYDQVVTPVASQFLSGENVTNVYVQDKCSLDHADHIALAFDHIALREVLNALDPEHASSTECTPVAPFFGG
ncbi:alpha/beta fold hydrolase [Pendulispora rubella]|uniref:Alpha/beta fold hydrolase n=1 Tax=Pendulispora rubella TaxID=2741070 RepID=A0ABZ2LJ58_9BACT